MPPHNYFEIRQIQNTRNWASALEKFHIGCLEFHEFLEWDAKLNEWLIGSKKWSPQLAFSMSVGWLRWSSTLQYFICLISVISDSAFSYRPVWLANYSSRLPHKIDTTTTPVLLGPISVSVELEFRFIS